MTSYTLEIRNRVLADMRTPSDDVVAKILKALCVPPSPTSSAAIKLCCRVIADHIAEQPA
jgi:hypothetical protein